MIPKIIAHSIRALRRKKSYVFFNIIGLAIGIACSLFIAIFILQEVSYDHHHEHKDRIRRVVLNGKISGQDFKSSLAPAPMGPVMREEFPEVENFLRMNRWHETVIRWGDKAFTEDFFVEVDSSFFDFFSVRLLQGDKQTSLNEPYSLVLSETTAQKIFGNQDPLGQMLKVGTATTLYKVTGVMEDITETSHFSANLLGSFMSNPRASSNIWFSNNFNTYVMLHPNADPAVMDNRFEDLVNKYAGPEIQTSLGVSMEEFLSQGNQYGYYTQPLTAIHLDTGIEGTFKPPNDPRYLRIFGSIGLLILIIAAINFMNLSTAQATKRAKEVGIKKLSGSSRGSLIRQFLTETLFIAFIALLFAIIIVEISLPYLNQLLNLNLKLNFISDWYTLPALILFTAVLGLLAGSYPAFHLSSFDPNTVLKGDMNNSKGSLKVRSVLIVVQFSISIILIVGTLIMNRQISFMLNKDLGFDSENIMVIRRASALDGKVNSFKQELKSLSDVVSVSASTAVPGHSNFNSGYTLQGRPDESFILQTNWVDYDFLETYGIQLSSGRFFNPELLTDRNACLINDRAEQLFMIDNPIEEKFIGSNQVEEGQVPIPVIGTVGDFHFESLRQDVGPYMFQFKHDEIQRGFVSVKLSPAAPKTVIQDIEKIWASFTANDPLIYFFMDENIKHMYREEERNATLSLLFTILTILIASLGLYGLTAYTLVQRTKEISIRKTFGASSVNIWRLISKEILLLVIISTAIAWPLIYLVALRWLENYHYRIKLNITDFLFGFLIAIIIALATISYRTIKAATVNPAASLKYE